MKDILLQQWSSETTCLLRDTHVTLQSKLHREQRVIYADNALETSRDILQGQTAGKPFLLVMTPTVARHYRAQAEACLAAPLANGSEILVLECRENNKSFEQTLHVCEKALKMNLRRGGFIIGMGGGVCLDVVGFAAAIYRRGVKHIKIPTTLIGLIDAGIGIKNGINFSGKKSVLGSFYPPEYAILDRRFLATVEEGQIVDGLSESLKMALISHPGLFSLLEKFGRKLIENRLSCDNGQDVVRMSVEGMLRDLSENLYELDSYERRVDFGHTFSPYIESASGYEIRHGQAVAIDMALSTVLARELGLLTASDCARVLNLISDLGLPLHAASIQPDELHASLDSVVAHRNGSLNLVVPLGIGSSGFVKDVATIRPDMLGRALVELELRHDEAGRR